MSSAKCCVCTDEFPGIDDLEAHISADHYNCLPFECEKCKFAKFPTEFAIKRHYEEDHGLVEYFIRYRVSREIYEKKQKIRECLERCIRHSDISSGQHQIALANRNIIGGDYASSSSHAAHYQSRQHQQQLHESEFLTPPTKIRTNHAELFSSVQQQHGPLLSSAAADIRHQHQSDFGAADNDPVSGYDSIGGPNLIGNLLEQIKPDMDAGPLSHFDQLYAAEVTTASEGPRGIEKYITTQTQSTSQEPISYLTQQKQPHNASGSNNIVATVGGTPTPPSSKQNGSASAIELPVTPAAKVFYSKRPTELQCQECKRMVVNRSTSLMYHVNVKHLKLAMFKCRSCGEEFLWNKSAAIRHAQRHGGDETLIENNSDRLFPTLNTHRREYFQLGKRTEDATTPPFQQQQSGQDEEPIKRARIEKEEDGVDEDDQEIVVENVDGNNGNDMEDKKDRTPNSILAQLVDMTRGTQSEGVKVSPTLNGSGPSSTSHQRGTMSTEHKSQKPIQCSGCGDLVINQEWILLNHVNTKHLHLPLYKCVSCNKPFENYLRSYAVRHAKFYHAGDESLLLDQRDVFSSELREQCSRLFDINKTSAETS